MPAIITYGPGANQGIQDLQQNYGFNAVDVAQLRVNIEIWVNNNYANWNQGAENFHTDSSNHRGIPVNIIAQLEDQATGEVLIVKISGYDAIS